MLYPKRQYLQEVIMIGGVNNVSTELAQIYKQTNYDLAETLSRIASGKKVYKPSDDFTGYVRARNMQTTIDGYNKVQEDLAVARGVAEAAVEVGGSIYDDLLRMKELAELYNAAGASTDDQAAYNAEFEAIGESVQNLISNNTYENTAIYSAATLETVYVNPDDTNDTLAIAFAAGDIIVDVSGAAWDLDGGGGAAKAASDVQAEIEKVTSYLVKAEGYVDRIDRQGSIADAIVQGKKAAQSVITDIDEVEEMSKATNLQIRQQAAISMMAQANLSRAGIMQLFT